MQNNLLPKIVSYLNKQKGWGKTEVYRSAIFDVMEYNSGRMLTQKDLPTGLLQEAATLVGGVYIPANKGKSKVLF